jgi:hypothetical protein
MGHRILHPSRQREGSGYEGIHCSGVDALGAGVALPAAQSADDRRVHEAFAWEAWAKPRYSDYPFTLITMNIDKGGPRQRHDRVGRADHCGGGRPVRAGGELCGDAD